MKNGMIRILVVSLAFLMLLVSAACGGGTDAPAATTPPAQTEEQTSASEEIGYQPLPQTRLNGFAFRFLNYDDSYLTWAVNPLDAEEQTGDVLNDEIWSRNNRIEETYDCAISEVLLSKPHESIDSLVQAGDVGAEVVMLYDERVLNKYLSGFLQTWDVLPYIDFTEPCWSLDATETFSVGGKAFAATGAFSTEKAGSHEEVPRKYHL